MYLRGGNTVAVAKVAKEDENEGGGEGSVRSHFHLIFLLIGQLLHEVYRSFLCCGVQGWKFRSTLLLTTELRAKERAAYR